MRWRASGSLPRKASATTVASKCTPSSPRTSARAPGRPCSISWRMVSAFKSVCSGLAGAACVHPGEAAHGDLGMITDADVVLALSYSGESDEILLLLPVLRRQGNKLIAM